MTQKISDALRRADCALAGAIFLSLSTVAASAALSPDSENVVVTTKVLPIVQKAAVAEVVAPVAPDIMPVPRPQPYVRMRIELALENFANEAGCLAEAMYYEARGEGVAGEKAIAEVVVRRAERPGFPHTICGVEHQGEDSTCQFSFVCDGAMERPKDSADWNRAVSLSTRILTGALPLLNATNGAIAFHAVNVQPDWPGLVRTVQIGNHVFYRRPGRTHSI